MRASTDGQQPALGANLFSTAAGMQVPHSHRIHRIPSVPPVPVISSIAGMPLYVLWPHSSTIRPASPCTNYKRASVLLSVCLLSPLLLTHYQLVDQPQVSKLLLAEHVEELTADLHRRDRGGGGL